MNFFSKIQNFPKKSFFTLKYVPKKKEEKISKFPIFVEKNHFLHLIWKVKKRGKNFKISNFEKNHFYTWFEEKNVKISDFCRKKSFFTPDLEGKKRFFIFVSKI